MIGTSPILFHFLFAIPPVEVPDVILPFLSTATQPTVPNLLSIIESLFFIFFSDFNLFFVIKFSLLISSNPLDKANFSAPSPDKKT